MAYITLNLLEMGTVQFSLRWFLEYHMAITLKKIECANHAVKCYRTVLEHLINDKPSYKGRGKLTEAMRKKLEECHHNAKPGD